MLPLETLLTLDFGLPAPPIQEWDLDTIFRNVTELNSLVSQNERSVEPTSSGAKLVPPTNIMQLTFFADGLRLDNGRFRSFSETATRSFMHDLSDGFFPAELQVKEPLFQVTQGHIFANNKPMSSANQNF